MREYTVVMEIDGHHLPRWMIDSFESNKPVNGITVTSIVEGDIVSRYHETLDSIKDVD